MLNSMSSSEQCVTAAAVICPPLTAEITSSAEDTTVASVKPVLSLADFVRDFGDSLIEAVRTQNPPVFTGKTRSAREVILAGLKRTLFAAQARTVHAVMQLLIDQDEKTAIINAEMGGGKSIMGIATAALLHAEGYTRTLILSPPHLVYKWKREILATLPDAEVTILNSADTLSRLQALRAKSDRLPQKPEFYILGRVRMRMGHHWRAAVRPQRVTWALLQKEREAIGRLRYERLASCPHCGALVKKTDHTAVLVNEMPTDRRLYCVECRSPLWTLMHANASAQPAEHSVHHALCQLPGIGEKSAEKLMTQFGEHFLQRCLSDNLHQFIHLMDENGEFIFSDKQAARLERAFANLDMNLGQSSYPASEYIKRYLPKHFFSLLIVDECHEYKGVGSAQGQAMGVLASQAKKVLLLTGTLMGGYGDDIFYLLWRVLPHRMLEDGYRYNARRSLGTAAMAFMEQHGVLKRTIKIQAEVADHRTARGKRETMQVTKAPGFSPLGITRYLLPYTVFLKLRDIERQALPPYQEYFREVVMNTLQAQKYAVLEEVLREELRHALRTHDQGLLGLVLNCLLAWPDCCFREETVEYPRSRKQIIHVPVVLGDEASPKEAEMRGLCLAAKREGRRTLVYTVYTGTRDTTARLKGLLDQAGLKAAVLRSSTAADKREDWIADQVDRGIDVLICHPELVKTGLDLLAFPTIVFMQSGFSTYTLLQAARRSWRIGQTQPVEVYFLGYEGTAQIGCLSLMAKKIAVSQSTSGTMPETGLDVLNQTADSIEVALAKQLV